VNEFHEFRATLGQGHTKSPPFHASTTLPVFSLTISLGEWSLIGAVNETKAVLKSESLERAAIGWRLDQD